MNRIIALLSWYDESPAWLAAAIASAHEHLRLDHVVALDGAYGLYPDGQPRSGVEQHHAITETCHALGLGLTLSAPRHQWQGNECEKRTALFRLGDSVSLDGEDWYYVLDADELVLDCQPGYLAEILTEIDDDVADVALIDRNPQSRGEVGQQPIRKLFRSHHGISVVDVHWHYQARDGRMLWGPGNVVGADLGGQVLVEHRNWQREMVRDAARMGYYQARDTSGIEAVPCVRCGERATRAVPRFLSWGNEAEQAAAAVRGECAIRAEQIQVCDDCAPAAIRRWEFQLSQRGVDAAAAERRQPVS